MQLSYIKDNYIKKIIFKAKSLKNKKSKKKVLNKKVKIKVELCERPYYPLVVKGTLFKSASIFNYHKRTLSTYTIIQNKNRPVQNYFNKTISAKDLKKSKKFKNNNKKN